MSRAVRYKKHLTTLQVFLSIVLILLTACVAVKAFFLKAPEQKVDELPSQPSSTGDPQLSEEEQAAQEALRSHLERKGGFYTILVSGSDDGNGNSDTNILVAGDTVNGYVYGVSIPRDSKAVWDGKSHKINAAFGSDMMSDVLAYVKDQAVLLTGLVNPQVVRTADMVEMKCIVFVRGKVPGPDILSLAEERDIVVMTCPKRMYEACGLLYSNGLRGNCDGDD